MWPIGTGRTTSFAVEMHLVHQTVRDAIAQLPADLPDELIERIAVDTWDHYDEHTRQIKTWLAK